MNKFEVVLIFSPDLATNSINSEIENFKNKLTTQSAKIINEENWGLRDLSYNINKFKKAFYRFFQIEAPGQIIKEINKDLNQSENLIRYLFIKVKEHQELPTKLNDEKKISLIQDQKEKKNQTHHLKIEKNSALLVSQVLQ
tara:strand:- start:2166 stop:2588 length:423 start_codon:yes stop_codon:yes gene_type:complete